MSQLNVPTVLHKLVEEVEKFQPAVAVLETLTLPIPRYVGNRLRARLMRALGFKIGSGTVIWGVPRILGSKGDARSKLSIGDNVWLNIDCSFELGESITIDDNVSIGPEVRILTTSHDLSEGTEIRRAMSTYEKPVRIGSGSWIGARVLILPGVTIGKGAVVAAGSLVRDDVPDNVLVAGVPARVIKQLP